MDIEMLRFRAQIIQKIRTFFIEHKYLETDTPALSATLIPETCLEVFKTAYIEPWSDQKRNLYLVPSPEVYMKKIIAQHRISIFQLSKCYRNVESCAHTHSPEFTMLEYYTINATYRESAEITEELLRALDTRFSKPFLYITMANAFEKLANFNLYNCGEKELEQKALNAGLQTSGCRTWNDLYQLLFVHSVEPRLGELVHYAGQPLFLTDYPAKAPCLAKDADKHSKERWELYIEGLELANCYSEETDAQKVCAYFEEEGNLKKLARIPHAIDRNYWKTFQNFPHCSGVAMGIDRLLMILTEKKSIDSVLPFPL